jgi:MFS transporter, DHA1 family, multidrug resistance protein
MRETIRELVRDAPLGQIIRFVSKGRYLKYAEEEPDFKFPDCWIDLMNNPDRPLYPSSSPTAAGTSTDSGSAAADDEHKPQPDNVGGSNGSSSDGAGEGDERSESGSAQAPIRDEEKHDRPGTYVPPAASARQDSTGHLAPDQSAARGQSSFSSDEEIHHGLNDIETSTQSHTVERVKSIPVVPKRTKDGAILVDWYYTDDPMNPHNWSNRKRFAVSLIICLYTFVVYTSSAIYTTSNQGIMKAFHVSEIKATLGLALYVLGYGIGPLIFSPLSEIPRIGRNPVYIATMFLFVILSIPAAFAPNYAGLMVLRFLTGFFGSPCLASGGASLGDMYSLISLPYALMAWVAGAYCGREYFLFLIICSPLLPFSS